VEVACAAGEVTLHADRGLLGEVLSNLLRNALEAVGERGRVRLEARPTEGGARLAVEDDGPGIPDSQMSLLFKPFSTTKKGGTGLGLPFCKKVVEEHSGAIRAERGSLGGARFVIELPGARESR
jgi:signal transduction histidine kinase